MALRKIALEGEACLSKVCRPVTDFNSRLHTLLDDLADTLADSGGVGLAAPQVGVLRRGCVVLDEEPGDHLHRGRTDRAGGLLERSREIRRGNAA